jgi:hypothetical protein
MTDSDQQQADPGNAPPPPDNTDGLAADHAWQLGWLAGAASERALLTRLAEARNAIYDPTGRAEEHRPFADLIRQNPLTRAAAPPGEATQAEPPLPDGRYARVELPGYRQHTGWVTDENRFGQQMAVVRNWDGQEMAAAVIGPNSQVLYLPTPLKRPDPQHALPAGRDDYDDLDDDDPRPF